MYMYINGVFLKSKQLIAYAIKSIPGKIKNIFID